MTTLSKRLLIVLVACFAGCSSGLILVKKLTAKQAVTTPPNTEPVVLRASVHTVPISDQLTTTPVANSPIFTGRENKVDKDPKEQEPEELILHLASQFEFLKLQKLDEP